MADANHMKLPALILYLLLFLSNASQGGIIGNGGFEEGLSGWRPLWTREPNTGTVTLDTQTVHGGRNSACIKYTGTADWSFEPDVRVAVQPGDLFEMEAWVKIAGIAGVGGNVTLCLSTWDSQGKVRDWSFAQRTASGPTDWQRLRSRFIVPDNVARIQPRLIGYGPVTLWLDDVSMDKKREADIARARDIPATLKIGNKLLALTLNTTNAALDVEDLRTGRHYQQKPLPPGIIVTDAKATGGEMRLSLFHVLDGLAMTATIRIEKGGPEFTYDLDARGALTMPLALPGPFLSQPGQYLVVPLNEGISYPVEDRSIDPMRLVAYGGHGICMAFWGATDGAQGEMAIIETPDDAAIQIGRTDGLLGVAPEWESQRGQFGYTRRLRYVFFDKGGHVAMAKRYRSYAQQIGLFKTLSEKRRDNPNIDLLVGAVNVWCWDPDAVSMVKEMQAAGIGHILWSNAQPPENLKALNRLGVLTSRYDIYQDVMNPDNFKYLSWVDAAWPVAGWPRDIISTADGSWLRGWAVQGKNKEWYSCGVMNDMRALGYARQRVPQDLATHPYRCRFIDTTTASPWHEDYDKNHPMTRTDSRRAKMALLEYISRDCKLVTGSETGHDAAAPYVDYFEGMLSLAPYRVPDAGRDMERIRTDVPEAVAKFQVGQEYRLPLWELVYHDCVVADWYWGDYSNKLPALWDKRDLFNVLYGTPPMFMFERASWEKDKARFVKSYKNVCPYVRAAGYSEMIDHRFLTPDRNVQQTAFANGMTVTVNFGGVPYHLADSSVVEAMGFLVK